MSQQVEKKTAHPQVRLDSTAGSLIQDLEGAPYKGGAKDGRKGPREAGEYASFQTPLLHFKLPSPFSQVSGLVVAKKVIEKKRARPAAAA